MKKILIIEDDSFLSNLESAKFTKEGFTVTVAMDAQSISTALDASPDVILLDLMLPEIDTYEFIKKTKEDPKTKSIHIIVFSNLSDDDSIKKCTDAGADDYMIKSNFTISDVISKINAIPAK
jgi:DNA-binding response OmpR family regulator